MAEQQGRPPLERAQGPTGSRQESRLSVDKHGRADLQEPFVTTPKARPGFCRHHPNERIVHYWCCEACPWMGYDRVPCKFCQVAKYRSAFNITPEKKVRKMPNANSDGKGPAPMRRGITADAANSVDVVVSTSVQPKRIPNAHRYSSSDGFPQRTGHSTSFG